ncbi:TonB-dependent receptor plug domain-containing protein [Litorimonas sp. RW-G-Af-16]|uniref:TonB-dependent receptor plug domain-containing protein n=1 Tax=Litorimonas sp. RW-G-Af-16 TaxID=3241168 RepID=UPI00390CB0C6
MTARFKMLLCAATIPLTLMISAQAVFAQTANNVFEAEFFSQYAPRNALDMVVQIPGFQLQGAEDRRGLGQGGANILINGERLTGKTDVGSQLSRIVAENVVRIEIKDGASLDIPGLSGQVADVITTTTGQTGTWSWAPQFRKRQKINLGHAHLTLSGETGNLTYSAELRNEANRNGDWGPEILRDAAGDIFEIRDELGRYNFDGPGGALDLTWKPRDDHTANLNLEYNKYNSTQLVRSSRRAQTLRGEDLETVFTGGENEWNAKAGADYEFPVGLGKLKMIGYYRFERSPTRSVFSVFALNGEQASGSIFDRLADETETIARTEYSWSPTVGRDWTLSAEGALNVLDIESMLQEFDGGNFVNIDINGATSRVEERRAETTLTHSRAMTAKWNLQASVGVEYSKLEQTGGLTRDFVRPKGFLLATYKPDESASLRFKIEREVDQLSFFDFISFVDVEDNIDRVGNINLVPSQSWNFSTEFDKDFGQGFTIKISPYFNLISDLVDRIPIGEDGDAVGNVDSAVQYGVDFNTSIKGSRWGWDGTQFDLDLEWRDSKVDDPVTGISRQLSRDKKTFWHARMRHDIPKTSWAYGGGVREFADYRGFRLFTTDDPTLKRPITYAFLEHKDVLGMKIKAEVINIIDSREEFTRQVFTDRRDRGVLDFTEFQSRAFGPILEIEFSGTF